MKTIIYPLRNIRLTFKEHRLLSAALIVSQIAAVIGILLSVGFITGSTEQKKKAEHIQRFFSYYFYVDDEAFDEDTGEMKAVDRNDPDIMFAPRFRELKEKVSELIEYCGEEFECLYLSCGIMDNGQEKTLGTLFGTYDENPTFTNTANSSRPVAICAAGEFSREDISGSLEKGDITTISGMRFEIADAEDQLAVDFIIPNKYLPDEAQVNNIQLTLSNQPTALRAQEIEEKFYSLFGRADYFRKPEIADLVEEQTANMYIGISVIVMIIVMLNISLYYKYIFDLRIRQMSILRICGETSFGILKMTAAEMTIEYILSFTVSSAVFAVLLKRLRESFPGFTVYDDSKLFYILAGAFLVLSVIISLVIALPYSRLSPTEALRSGRE